jgi:hypothetical protein
MDFIGKKKKLNNKNNNEQLILTKCDTGSTFGVSV